MQQELTTSKQIVEAEQRYKRECKGRSLALTRNVYRLVNTDVFYVKSESSNDIYYFVKFKPDVVEYCSCLDNSLRGGQMNCKHLHAIGFAIRLGTLRDTERLPTEAKVSKVVSTANVIATAKSYTDDDYSFWLVIAELMMKVPSNNQDKKDQYKKLFTIQYTKEELDKITLDFVTQMNKYIARVNDRILKTFEEIEKEETTVAIVVTRKSLSYKEDDYNYSFWFF